MLISQGLLEFTLTVDINVNFSGLLDAIRWIWLGRAELKVMRLIGVALESLGGTDESKSSNSRFHHFYRVSFYLFVISVECFLYFYMLALTKMCRKISLLILLNV